MINYNTDENKSQVTEENKILKDVLSSGKEYNWRELKRKNLIYNFILEYATQNEKGFLLASKAKLKRIRECAEKLFFAVFSDGTEKFHHSVFCKSRLCAMCNRRKSLKLSYDTQRIVESVKLDNQNLREIFLTLTVKNVFDGEELSKSLADIHKGFRKLLGYSKVEKSILGGIRATEITVNKKDGSYNQHIHVLMFVDRSYFSKCQENYISQEEWTSLWQKACKLNYTPVVHVQSVKNTFKSALEVAKYSVKDSDYINLNIDYKNNNNWVHLKKSAKIVRDLEVGLKGKRLNSYFGLCKDKAKELDIKDIEEADLNDVPEDENEIVAIHGYRWSIQGQEHNYYLHSRQGYQEFKQEQERMKESQKSLSKYYRDKNEQRKERLKDKEILRKIRK